MDVKQLSKEFDEALEKRDYREILGFFHEECEIEILNKVLRGKKGAEKWLDWLYENAPKIRFEPSVIISEENTFYEEFYAIVTLENGTEIRSHQAETLIYEDNKLKTLRVFLNPLDFSEIVAKDPFSNWILKTIKKKAVKGL
ncbi:MAG: hypothetical protein GF364_00510 [Candidatus Lokiarchaeota archaeon]|nr:hypothetical protein [Candidatus Lokiarchaeota archaeon]